MTPPTHNLPPYAKDDSCLHNPDNLTPEQVGTAYRLLLPKEVDGRHKKVASMWSAKSKYWDSICLASYQEYSYRVPLSTPWPPQPTPKPESGAKTAGETDPYHRDEFEGHCALMGQRDIRRKTGDDSRYENEHTQRRWESWSAAIAFHHQSQPSVTHTSGPISWRTTILDTLIIAGIYRKEHDENPQLALSDLIKWEQQVALDPLVSEDARKLRDTYKAPAETGGFEEWWKKYCPDPGSIIAGDDDIAEAAWNACAAFLAGQSSTAKEIEGLKAELHTRFEKGTAIASVWCEADKPAAENKIKFNFDMRTLNFDRPSHKGYPTSAP